MPTHRIYGKITGVVDDEKGGLREIRLENHRGRDLRFYGTGAKFSPGQLVEMTAHKITKDGVMEGVRLSRFLPVESDPTQTMDQRERYIGRVLEDFAAGLRGTGRQRKGSILIEGLTIKVVKHGRFRIPYPGDRGYVTSHHGRDAARMIFKVRAMTGHTIRTGRKPAVRVEYDLTRKRTP